MIGKNDLEYFSRQAQGGCLDASEQQAVVREVAQAQAEVERYHLASLGMFDPVKVGQVVAQLQMERDEARDLARRMDQNAYGWLCGEGFDAELNAIGGLKEIR